MNLKKLKNVKGWKWCKKVLKIGLAGAPYGGAFSEAWNQYDASIIEKEFQLLKAETESLKKEKGYSFGHAYKEYHSRMCRIGFVHGPQRGLFVTNGYGTFIGPRTVLTTGGVLEMNTEALKVRAGEPVVLNGLGITNYKLKKRYEWGDHAIITLGPDDMSGIGKDKTAEERNQLLAMIKPLETKVRTRHAAYMGEEVGFFNGPENNTDNRPPAGFQLETARISFRVRTKPPSYSDAALTPIFSRIEYAGAGVFSEDGLLIGVVKHLIDAKDEIGRRVVISNFLGVKELGGLGDLEK